MRRAQSNVLEAMRLLPSPETPNDKQNSPLEMIAELPPFHFIPALQEEFNNPHLAFQKGVFQRIQPPKIDLPPPRKPPNPEDANIWIQRLPDELKGIFADSDDNPFTSAIHKFLKDSKDPNSPPLPPSKTHASPTQYVTLLDRAEASGMLHWEVLQHMPADEASLSSAIEMTLFAVSKSKSRSRLISWPRIQNQAIPDPPHTALPDPTLFDAVTMEGEHSSAFYVDLANMFHNITLPTWLAKLFPMPAVPVNLLSSDTVKRISARVSLPTARHTLLRPYQATMPMGFKWAVHVAQTFVQSCLNQAFHIFRSSRFAPPGLSHAQFFRKDEAPFRTTPKSPIILHMIDDIVVITRDWPPQATKTLHRIIRNVLRLNKLPVNEKKSCDISHVETKSIQFIGCVWDLRNSTIIPERSKFTKVTMQVEAALSARTTTYTTWKRLIGRLLWFATLNRPLLACTQAVFRIPNTPDNSRNQKITASDKRELGMLAKLLPLARVCATLPVQTVVIAFDASLSAGAVTYTYLTPDISATLLSEAQKAKFQTPNHLEQPTQAALRVVKGHHWTKAFSHSWVREDHINALEASTAVLALEWAARKGICNSRLVMLTDSLVTMGALQKGRSSAPSLLVRCRRFSALALAHGIRVFLAYVPSEHNPADRYTRE